MDSSRTFLNNYLLIAMPALKDLWFQHAVTYICEHNESGAMGLMINQPSDMQLSELFASMQIDASQSTLKTAPILWGGPVQKDRGFIMHKPDGKKWQASLQLSDDLAITSSRDMLEAIAENTGPENPLVSLGYAGWTSGQLEQEILDNCWLHMPADPRIIFDTPFEQRWQAAVTALGLNVDNILSLYTGHA